MSIKEDTDCLKNNKEIIKALEEGKEKLEFIKQTYEIEKQNFFLDINDLKKEIIRVNRDNNFLKTVVKDLSMKIDELPERKELIK